MFYLCLLSKNDETSYKLKHCFNILSLFYFKLINWVTYKLGYKHGLVSNDFLFNSYWEIAILCKILLQVLGLSVGIMSIISVVVGIISNAYWVLHMPNSVNVHNKMIG